MLKRQGRWHGKEDRQKGEKEKKEIKWNTLDYAYICDWCLHNNTINNHYRHSHCLLNLVYTEKYLGMETQKGWLVGEKTSIKATSCSQHHESQNGSGQSLKTRPVSSSILILSYECLTAVQLFTLTQKLWFHHLWQGTKMEFCMIHLGRIWVESPAEN